MCCLCILCIFRSYCWNILLRSWSRFSFKKNETYHHSFLRKLWRFGSSLAMVVIFLSPHIAGLRHWSGEQEKRLQPPSRPGKKDFTRLVSTCQRSHTVDQAQFLRSNALEKTLEAGCLEQLWWYFWIPWQIICRSTLYFFHLLVTSWTRGPHFLSLHLNVLLDSRQEICRTLVMEGNIFARPCERMSAWSRSCWWFPVLTKTTVRDQMPALIWKPGKNLQGFCLDTVLEGWGHGILKCWYKEFWYIVCNGRTHPFINQQKMLNHFMVIMT